MRPFFSNIADKIRRYFASPKKALSVLRSLPGVSVIRRSPLFDREWYLAQNPDVRVAGSDPALHYLFCGHSAKRDPGPDFCGEEYLALNPAARASSLNPLVHYEKYGRESGAKRSEHPLLTLPEQQKSFARKIAAIREKVSHNGKIKVLFFVTTPSIFPARPLFEAMLHDPSFTPRIVVIPDLRWPDKPYQTQMDHCLEELGKDFSREYITGAKCDVDGLWETETDNADIVCYPMPYDLSSYKYNPRYALEGDFLPVYVNYGYPCTRFAIDVMHLDNYAVFWKVFLENEYTAETYNEASVIGGINGVITGCVKLDRLASLGNLRQSNRKTLLICPHHSVEGGLNNLLALSNFLRLADYFKDLPARFPDIDFIFRPHPFLIKTLSSPKFWGEQKVAAYRAALVANRNLTWSDAPDYLREFAISDGIIQDCASFTVEYAYTGKPCCYILKTPDDIAKKFLPIGQDTLKSCYQAYTAEDIDQFISNVILNGKDPFRNARLDFCHKIMINFPHATETALKLIKSAIM